MVTCETKREKKKMRRAIMKEVAFEQVLSLVTWVVGAGLFFGMAL